MILSLYFSLMRPPLNTVSSSGGPQRKDMDLLELNQKKATKIVRGLDNLTSEDGLRLFSLQKRKL